MVLRPLDKIPLIVHADMDAFYASVEIRENPHLTELPVAVGGHANKRGVISAANYIARKYRVHSALPTKLALQRCPELVLLPGRIDLYAQISKQIHEIFYRYTPLIEPLSLDEAFLDVTQSVKLFGSDYDIGKFIKRDVLNELQLVISIGIATNKFIAKIASDLQKPNGFVYVEPGKEQAFLDPLPISRIWGIGKRSNERLSSFGIETIKHLRELPENFLEQQFGKHGTHIRQLAFGLDPRPVESEQKAKSISHERTFATDIHDKNTLISQLSELTEQVAWRLRDKKTLARTVQIKIRFADFSTITRSRRLAMAANDTATIWSTVKKLFDREKTTFKQPVRLIGMGTATLTQIDSPKSAQTDGIQQDLFQHESIKQHELDSVSDKINQKFGGKTVSRASSVRPKSSKK